MSILYIDIPKGFFPTQDTGRLMGFIQADQSISFQAMQPKLASFVNIVRADPAVENVVAFTGGSQRNTGQMFVQLKPLAERKESADKIIARLRIKLANEPGANLFLNPVQDIRVGGRQANATYQYTLQADDLDELRTWEPRIRQALRQLPQLVDVNTDQQDKGLQTSLVIDRDAAARLGVSPRLIDTTLNDAFGQRQVSTIYSALNQYHVVMEAAPEYWQSADSLDHVYVSTANGAQVPLSAFARYAPHQHLARRQPPIAVRGVHHLVQFAGRHFARAGDAGDRGRADADRRSGNRSRQLSGHGARVSGFPQQPAVAHSRRAPHRLHRARHPVRKLRPSDHDSVDAAVGGRRRPARLDAVSHRVQRHRPDRRHSSHRHREEERDHDDRLCARRRAPPQTRTRARRFSRPACCASVRS